jgi:putative membrane protein
MERVILRVGLAFAANFIALLIAALVLDKFTIDEIRFVWAVLLFTAVSLATGWAVRRLLRDHAPAAVGLASLITTWLALLLTDLLSDHIQIEGVGTWIAATLIIWGADLVLELLPGPWRREARARRAAAR